MFAILRCIDDSDRKGITMHKSILSTLALIVTVTVLLGGCKSNQTSSSAASSAESQAKVVLSATANASAETLVKSKVDSCMNAVPTTALVHKAARQQLVSCLEGLVPASTRSAFGTCVGNAAFSDKAWTKAGRAELENSGIGTCVTSVNSSASSSPTASATSS
jgi:hypothetical protein